MPGNEPAWVITNQREDWQLDRATGQIGQGMTVTFRTAAGHVGSIFLPAERYTVEGVRAAVVEKAHMLDTIGSLRG